MTGFAAAVTFPLGVAAGLALCGRWHTAAVVVAVEVGVLVAGWLVATAALGGFDRD